MNRPLVSALAGLASLAATATPHAADVPYPAGYRSWTHVKSMVIQPGHPLHASFGGIHHLYANAKAMQGYKTGRFQNGSVIVFDLLEANTTDNAITEGPRKVAGVMHRDTGKYATTGGWGFEGFVAGDPAQRAVGANAKTACFDCHAPQKNTGYVFSTWRQ